MRRVKLTTEWATWCKDSDQSYRLRGDDGDFCATAIMYGVSPTWTLRVYTKGLNLGHGWEYGLGENLPEVRGLTIDEALIACEHKLVECGLIDPLWWATQ